MSTQEVPESLTKIIMLVILMARSGVDHERIVKEAEEAILSHMIDKQKVEEAIDVVATQHCDRWKDDISCIKSTCLHSREIAVMLRQALSIGKETKE